MQVRELLQALDLVGQVYRSNDGTRAADPILKVKARLAGSDSMMLTDWVAQRATTAQNPTAGAQVAAQPELTSILETLEKAAENTRTEAAFQKLDSITLNAENWKKLAKLATGRRATSGRSAKDALRSHLANQVQLHNRRENIDKVFPL